MRRVPLIVVLVLAVSAGCAALTPGPDGPTGIEAVDVSVLQGSRDDDVHLFPSIEANTTATMTLGTLDNAEAMPHHYYVVNHAKDSRSVHVLVHDEAILLNATVSVDPGEKLVIELGDARNYRTTVTVRADGRVVSKVRVQEYASNFNCNAKYLTLTVNGNGTVASGVVSTAAGCY